ncbi:kinase-like domain-containing protein [Xylariales sp. PMI_506]|nr:kinase-like domain-containing protein [Xylariales sp. PMI_506]
MATAPPTAPAIESPAEAELHTPSHVSTQSLPSPQIAIHGEHFDQQRPAVVAYMSAPAVQQQFHSPLRQHKRTPSQHREVKETLNARSEYMSDEADGTKLRINQYVIREEIGRGSYGAVHRATDQFGTEFAIKEFSKARLRKRAQSNILKRPHDGRPGHLPPGRGMRAPWSTHMKQLSSHNAAEAKDPMFLIREEIAIMKKLNHPNLVSLIEVLDDPDEDSLWMVLEMCKKGVVMKVGLDEIADPYPEETCRHWFRDLVLGIEYLHAQGVVHRDIKPDNLLLTEDDCLKIVDFGVSEMFEKPDNMMTAKSAGSPAFLPPELCVARHGDIDGKAADIWSMGVSLYCLRYGKLPFCRDTILDMYEAIRTEEVQIPLDENPDFADIVGRLLDKNAHTRICMEEIRNHPWVTGRGSDPLLSEEENCVNMVGPPNELEVNHALTRKMSNMLVVMIAINKFKLLLIKSRAATPTIASPRAPKNLDVPGAPSEASAEKTSPAPTPPETETQPRHKSVAEEAAELVEARKAYLASSQFGGPTRSLPESKDQAQDVAEIETRFLGIGLGGHDGFTHSDPPAEIVSDSPTGIDFDVYDKAFEAEMERIRSEKRGGRRRTTYLTRLVGEKEKYFGDDCMVVEAGKTIPSIATAGMNKASSAAVKTLEHIRLAHRGIDAGGNEESRKDRPGDMLEERKGESGSHDGLKASIKEKGHKFADLVMGTIKDAKAKTTD